MLLPHRSSAFGHLHTRAATRLLDLCSREDDSSLARSRRTESGRDPMTSASGKSRAVKDPARCSRAVNMTVTAAPVANGQSWVREKGSPRSKKATCRVEAARRDTWGGGSNERMSVTGLAQERPSGEACPQTRSSCFSAGGVISSAQLNF